VTEPQPITTVTSRNKTRIELVSDEEFFKEYHFVAETRIKTNGGETGTVAGMDKDKRLWVILDKDKGLASYWDDIFSFQDFLAKKYFTIIS